MTRSFASTMALRHCPPTSASLRKLVGFRYATLVVATVLCLAQIACFQSRIARAAEHPNIVIMLADDQGWGDLSVHGNTNLSTPNIDSLATDGVLFDRFYVCPVCAPTRAEFLTGRYYARTGVRGVSTGQERINPDEVTIADIFKQAGYATGAFGKWHNGSQFPYHPNARGFEEYYGFTSGHWGHYFDPMLEHNNEITRGKGYITDDLTTHAMEFMETNHKQDKPFFCYLPYNTPHSPMQVPDEYFDKVANRPLKMHNRNPKQEDMPHLRAALAMCENIDWNVGRVLKKIDELSIAEDTIVIYFSDNGPNGWRWNGGMKGRKGSIDEGGVRVPMLMRWPGHIVKGKTIEPIAGAVDLLPTLTELASVPHSTQKPLDGRSLVPLLRGNDTQWSDRMLISYQPPRGGKGKTPEPRVSIRNQQFRMDPSGKLYDITADPGQDTDVSNQHPDLVREMKRTADQYVQQLGDLVKPDERPFPVGEAPTTLLPARDGVEHGSVQRSARAPNCSYFTHWVGNPEDAITWDIEVSETATFDVEIFYACAADDVGAKFQLDFGDAKLTGKVTQAHDPPAYGAESDRTPNRGSESYVKDFKPMNVGKITLAKGRGLLKISATEVPGDEVMEVRLLRLSKQK
ncbi:arylsulfatase [Novipirellula sp. SH528]|uniref:arylsulfatase n=1 Tax=Novipirellula sp. SH528 TaxID=3454466 RepID=UPI003F9F3186